MSIHPPRILSRPPDSDPLGLLKQEIAAESAASLGKTYRDLLESLSTLSEAERVCRESPTPQALEWREAALSGAGEALWYFVVQREACGLRNTEAVVRELRIPAPVQLRMGVRTSRA